MKFTLCLIAFTFLLLQIDARSVKRAVTNQGCTAKKPISAAAIIASLVSPNSNYVIETRYSGVGNSKVDVSAAGLQKCDYTSMTTQVALADAKKKGYNSSLCPITYLCNIQPGRTPETLLFAENLQYECGCGLGRCEYLYIGQKVSEFECDSTLGMMVRKDYTIPVRVASRCVFKENYKKYTGNFMQCSGFNLPPSAFGQDK